MSIEAYKIAVKISLVENVTRGLALMSRHFKTTDADAAKLEARLKSIGKMFAVGGILTGAGLGGLALFKGPLDEAKKYQVLLERFDQFGMGDIAKRDAEKFVQAQHIMGASQRDMLRYFVESQGVFRESGAHSVAEQLAAAKMAAPMLARMNFASRGLDEHSREILEGKQMDMLRFVEQAGGLKSAARFNDLLNSGFKAVQSSGGNVDFTQYRQFMARGGSAAMNLVTRALFADLEPIIGEMKGSTAGNALMTSFNRLNGIVRLPNQVSHELVNNGLWDGSKIIWNSQGGIKSFTGNPMRNAALFGSDPVEYYRTMIQPMYSRMNLDSSARIVENAKIFGRTGGAMFNLIERQMPTILRSREAFNRSHGIAQTYAAVGKTPTGREIDLTAKEADLKLAIGKIIMPYYVKGLEMALSVLTRLNAFATAHPVFTKIAVGGFALISTLSLIGGGLTLLVGGLKGLGLIAGFASWLTSTRAVGLVIRSIVTYAPALLSFARFFAVNTLAALGGGFVVMVKDIALGVRLLGAALFANPIGLAILAIAAVGWLVYNNWKEIRAALGAIWSDIKTGVTQLFSGDILGALRTFGHAVALGFQTIFNTIIAGVNKILPAAWQIGKFNFAGDPQGNSPTVRPGAGQPIQVHSSVHLDGRKVAQAVTQHQTKGASRPNTGGGWYDTSRGAPSFASPASR